MPVAERSSRPGRDDDGVLRDGADAPPRLGDLDDADAGDLRVLRDARTAAARAPRRGSARRRARARAPPRARARSRARCASAIAYHMPPNATSTVSVPSPSTSSCASRCSAKHGTFVELDAHALAVAAPRGHLDDAGRRLEPQRRLGLAHLDHAGLEQHRRDADRVRAGHRGVLGRLHDDVAGLAVVALRRDDQIRVHGDAAARLAQQQAPQRVVARERLHLLEHGVARRRQHPADDDVADLSAGVAADDGQCPFQFEPTPTFATKMSDFLPLDGVALPQLRTSWLGESIESPVVSPGQTFGIAELGRDLLLRGEPAGLRRERAEVERVPTRVAVRQPAHVRRSGRAADDGHDVRHVRLVGRRLHRRRPRAAVIRREGEPADVVRRAVGVRSLRIPGGVEVAAVVDADVVVDPPLRERHRPDRGADRDRRRPRRAPIRRRREVADSGVHRVGRRVRDVVALVEHVDAAVGLDDERREVAAARREARADRDDRAPRLPAVRRALHDGVEVAGQERAAAVRRADVRHRRAVRAVVPGDVHGAVGADGDEVAVAPVLRVGRHERAHLREGEAVIERRRDDGIPLRAVRDHERRVHGAVRADGDRRIPGVEFEPSEPGTEIGLLKCAPPSVERAKAMPLQPIQIS